MSKRRVLGEIVYRRADPHVHSDKGGFGQIDFEMNITPTPCCLQCGDPDCMDWPNVREFDENLRPLESWIPHVSECQMDDVFEPEGQPVRRGDVVQATQDVVGERFFDSGFAVDRVVRRGEIKVVSRQGADTLILDEVITQDSHTGIKVPVSAFARIGRARYYPDGTPVED